MNLWKSYLLMGGGVGFLSAKARERTYQGFYLEELSLGKDLAIKKAGRRAAPKRQPLES